MIWNSYTIRYKSYNSRLSQLMRKSYTSGTRRVAAIG